MAYATPLVSLLATTGLGLLLKYQGEKRAAATVAKVSEKVTETVQAAAETTAQTQAQAQVETTEKLDTIHTLVNGKNDALVKELIEARAEIERLKRSKK